MPAADMKETIWQVVAAIPEGQVATYGQVARLAGLPAHARYVGTTLKNLPRETRLPWYRVINGKGQLSFPSHCSSWHRQKQHLEAEGVVFIGDKIPLRQFQWSL